MNPWTEDRAVFRLAVDQRGDTPISYCGDCLVVDRGVGHLRAFTENGRGFNHDNAAFDRGLGRSLLDGFLVSCLVVGLIEILAVCHE